MSAVLVVAQGPVLYLLSPSEVAPQGFRASDLPEGPGRPATDPRPDRLPPALVDELSRSAVGLPIAAGSTSLARALSERLGRPVETVPFPDLRRARARLPGLDPAVERTYLLAVARRELVRSLRAPEEVLVVLAREEERLARSVGREDRAAGAFVAVPSTPLAAYAQRWGEVRSALTRHHAELLPILEAAARELVPNLSAVVGPRVAARLVAAAGGVPALGRLRASRLQLLGSRRRPSPDRGPRYGLLFNAERMGDVPLHRRGAYARSLAALASIAARADASTHADIAAGLVRRRDRRVEDLRRTGR